MRIATWNVEWFINLFDVRGRLLEDGERSSRYNVTRAEQLRGIGQVLRRLDADAVMVIEAPDNSAHRQTVPLVFCSVFVRDCVGRGRCMDDHFDDRRGQQRRPACPDLRCQGPGPVWRSDEGD